MPDTGGGREAVNTSCLAAVAGDNGIAAALEKKEDTPADAKDGIAAARQEQEVVVQVVEGTPPSAPPRWGADDNRPSGRPIGWSFRARALLHRRNLPHRNPYPYSYQ